MKRFDRLTFDSFKTLATDTSLLPCERIGFDKDFREGFEPAILDEIVNILDLNAAGKLVIDIGPGCDTLAKLLIKRCGNRGHSLVLVDSAEMLSQLPDLDFIDKYPTIFPEEKFVETYSNKADAVLIYSVIQHVMYDMNPFIFLDNAVLLLSPGGKLLLGDIPNISKRNRNSKYNQGSSFEKIDDSLIFSILQRYRTFGFETYLLKQSEHLPLNETREHVLIWRPK
jgi:hypothetical protein